MNDFFLFISEEIFANKNRNLIEIQLSKRNENMN